MKRLLIILIILFLSGCNKIKTQEYHYSIGNPLPDASELIGSKDTENTIVELEGDKLVIRDKNKDEDYYIPVIYDEVEIDIIKGINIADFYTDISKAKTVSTSISEDGTKMTITNLTANPNYSFEVPIKIKKPEVEIPNTLIVDNITTFDIFDYIKVPEGFEVEYEIDYKNKDITISLTNGTYQQTFYRKITDASK